MIKLFIKNVFFKNIGKNYCWKTKKITTNYASTTNQINIYWRFFLKQKLSSYQLQLKAYYILLHPKLEVNFCTFWNTNWLKMYMHNCTLSFRIHNNNSITISMSGKWITPIVCFRNEKISYTNFEFWWLIF